jgi:hypothetical protein
MVRWPQPKLVEAVLYSGGCGVDDEGRDTRALQDEHERRMALEERLAELQSQALVWRQRAEDCRAKLDETWWRRIRRRASPSPPAVTAKRETDPGFVPLAGVHPQIRVAVLAGSGSVLLACSGGSTTLIDGVVPPADIVVVEQAAYESLSGDARNALKEVLTGPGAPPIVELLPDGRGESGSACYSEMVSSLTVFDPREDPLCQAFAPELSGEDERVRWTRQAYRTIAPERHLERWLDACGIEYRSCQPHVSGLLVSMRPDELGDAVDRFDGQTWERTSLVIGCHRFDDHAWGMALDRYGEREDVTMLRFGPETTLGECLNEAASVASGDVLAKWDDDDHYGPGYLEDAVNALRYSGCDIIVKATQYTYLEARDVTILRRPGVEETKFSGDASGGTYVFRRRVWEDAPFAHRHRAIDIKFLAAARAVGYEVYSNSRFDFAYRKRASGSTWAVSDDLIAAQGDVVWEGPPGSRVDA